MISLSAGNLCDLLKFMMVKVEIPGLRAFWCKTEYVRWSPGFLMKSPHFSTKFMFRLKIHLCGSICSDVLVCTQIIMSASSAPIYLFFVCISSFPRFSNGSRLPDKYESQNAINRANPCIMRLVTAKCTSNPWKSCATRISRRNLLINMIIALIRIAGNLHFDSRKCELVDTRNVSKRNWEHPRLSNS